MEQRSYPYYKSKNNSYYNGNISRNQIKSNNTVINLVNIIYDNEFVSLINELSSSLKECFKLINKLVNNIKEISASFGNQIIFSKCLINDYITLNKKNNNDKLLQVKDRLDFMDNNKNLLESNISFMNVNISSFLEHAKILFKRMKVSRNNKLNKIQNDNGVIKNDFKFNNYFSNNSNYNSNDNFNSKITKNRRNYSSYDNMRYKAKSQNTFQNYNSLSFKKNKSFKNISGNLLINSSDDVNNNNNYLEKKNDNSERQKTISFNLRRFIFNKDKNKVNNLLENISLNKENKINNNLLFNYCSLINNSKAKNTRKKNNTGNIKSLKNINSFKSDNRINNNFFNHNIYENRNNSNITNNKKKINFNYNSNSHILIKNNNDIDNSDSLKIVENNNKLQKDLNTILANKIIEYFTLLKNSEKNKIKIEKLQKYLINISLNIINKKENHINSLKHNYLKNTKIQANIFRNLNVKNSQQIRASNTSIGNKEKKESNENIINILNKELNKKNEYIRKIKDIMMENNYNKNNGIVKAQNFEIIQKRKLLVIIKKEINLDYLSDNNNKEKEIEELKNKINELKQNNLNENSKNYKYKYELILEEINTKKKEINELNNKLEELNKNNNSLLNKLDTMELSKKNLEQEKTNLLLKIKKLEDFSTNKKIIITNSDEEPIEDFSDIIEEQSSENEKEKKLIKENNKLQEKINLLQLELNKKLMNENDKNRKLSRNGGNNEYENCVEFEPVNRIKKEKEKNETNNNNMEELKKKEDLIEKLQAKIKEHEQNKNIIYTNKKDEYIILSEKNYKTLKWFLLTKKIHVTNLNYKNVFWADKEHVSEEIIKNNKYENSEEEKMILIYLKKLEEKENMISKLKLKIQNMEKNVNVDNKNKRSKSTTSKNYYKNNNNEDISEDYEDFEDLD